MILSRYFDFHVCQILKLFQVAKDWIFPIRYPKWMRLWTCMAWIRSTKKQTIVHLMKTGNWRVQKIAFLFMLKAALHSLYVRWWLTNVKCQRSNLVSDSSDQKLSVVPSLTRSWSFLELTYLEIQVRARNIIMADAQTDYLNDYWTKCNTATRSLFGDWLKCYDFFIHTTQKF